MMTQGRRFTVADAINTGIFLLKVIEKVHNSGFCHADIKPENILIKSFNFDQERIDQI